MNTDKHFNQLTPAEAERLAILTEEMGEALQIVGKILRHGYDSYDPIENNHFKTNRFLLEIELGDVRHAMIALCEAGDLYKTSIHLRAEARRKKIRPYLHHQPALKENDDAN